MLSVARLLVFALALHLALHLLGERKRGALPAATAAAAALWLLALMLVTDAVGDALADSQSAMVAVASRASWSLRAVAPVLWLVAALALVPPSSRWHERLRLGRLTLLPLALVLAGWVAGSSSVLRVDPATGALAPGTLWPAYVTVVAVAALAALLVLGLARREIGRPYFGVLVAGTIFLGMSLFGVVTTVTQPALTAWATVAVGCDLLLLAAAVEALDAFEAGERRGRRVLRRAAAELLPALLVAAQVAWALSAAALGPAGVALLYGAVATVVVAPRLLKPWTDRAGIDPSAPSPAGATTSTLPDGAGGADRPTTDGASAGVGPSAPPGSASDSRRPPSREPVAVASRPPREAFGKQVRRALSAAGDLPRLASSPLTAWVPPSGTGSPAERAQRLRNDLLASIIRLRPAGVEADDVTSPAWRHFNVLYLPYVRGVRISSRDPLPATLDEAASEAARWLRREVPERTFFRWQSAAAALVADDLWARWWPAETVREHGDPSSADAAADADAEAEAG